ncbi:hypothetical protein ACQPXH_17515 [Nocardia sp. CA-135953]|uniref:hypothetical protein n=1 Tax=Nocardia sp. CA-135953 TaxID=3239978 RepID=UPI003D95A522
MSENWLGSVGGVDLDAVGAHLIGVEDLVYRVVAKIIAAGAISVALGLQPAIAVAAPDGTPPQPELTARTQTTAPFDPVCPLCFLRELIESGSSH